MISPLRVPFRPESSNFKSANPTYCSMLLDSISPHFTLRSLTFGLIVICTLCLVIPQFFYYPHNYFRFLTFTNIPHVYLDAHLVRFHHQYIYQTITAMFFHMNFLHWFSNMLMAMFLLTAVEYMWMMSVVIALVAGIATNLWVVVIFDGVFMGVSGVLGAGLGIYIAYLVMNWEHLKENYEQIVFASWMYGCFFMTLMLFSNNWKTTSLHFIALLIGFIFAMGFLPTHSPCPNSAPLIFKLLSLVTLLLPLTLILTH